MKRLPEVIALVLLLLFFYVRFPSTPWNRVIHSDGKGYYAHLPAIFIYHDLEYGFADEMEKKYYPEDGHLAKHFRFKFKGETVNKTFSGITILWLPFFLLAHFLSLLLGFPTDGYSVIYQTSIGLSAIFYFWIGSRLFLRLLKQYAIPDRIAGFVLIAFTFGTNLFYYLLLDPSLTHSYNFSIIAAFLLFIKQFSDQHDRSPLLKATACFALLLCIRPQDGFIAFALPFVIGTPEKIKGFFRAMFTDIKRLLQVLLIFLAFIAVPVSLWYLQTGYFLVYSYGEEGFDFSNPQFFNVLFSYQKGLFLYTPIVFVSMFGLLYLFKKDRFRFLFLLLFLLINTYIISSWEEWWYGCSYGHRVFIDFYAIPAILLGMLYLFIGGHRRIRWVLHSVIVLLIAFNLVQVYQHYNSIVPACFNNKTLYWQNLLKLIPDARASLNREDVVMMHIDSLDMETGKENWKGLEGVQSSDFAYSGSFAAHINKDFPYGPAFTHNIVRQTAYIKVSAMIYCQNRSIDPKIVVDIQSHDGQSWQYQNFSLKKYLHTDRWFKVEMIAKIDPRPSDEYKTAVYFWQPEEESPLYIDNMSVALYKRSIAQLISDTAAYNAYGLVNRLQHISYGVEAPSASWSGWKNSSSVSRSHSGELSSKLSKYNAYSVTHRFIPDPMATHVAVSAMIYSTENNADPVLIVDVQSENGQSMGYHGYPLQPYLNKNKWVSSSFLTALEPDTSHVRNIVVYYWLPEADSEEVFIDDIVIDTYTVLAE